MGAGVYGGCFPGPAGGRPFRRGFDGSCDPVRGIGTAHGLGAHAFREIGEPVQAHFLLPRPGDGVVTEYRIEFAPVHPVYPAKVPVLLMAVVGGARQIGQAGISDAGEFLVLSIALPMRGGATFPGFGRRAPGPAALGAPDERFPAGDGAAGCVAPWRSVARTGARQPRPGGSRRPRRWAGVCGSLREPLSWYERSRRNVVAHRRRR